MTRQQTSDTDIQREFQEIIRHAEALLDATAVEVDERVKQARARLDERLVEARSKFEGMGEDIRNTVEVTDRLVHAKPYHAIGGSFLVGLLLGWFMRGK
jgi:ElaB/YqjD/DUF883 family membrane-anchored ribosome-binding protein